MAVKNDIAKRKRVFIDKKAGAKDRIEVVKWAATNNFDTVVFSLDEKLSPKSKIIKLAKRYSLNIEAGGHDYSLLLPEKLFLFHKELFRMEHGERKKRHHFCPTNPQTTSIIKERAEILFIRFMNIVTVPRVFHFLPDEGYENTWCGCPACRAFSPAEQNIIAANTAADVLLKLDPDAYLAFKDIGETISGNAEHKTQSTITPRKNMIGL
jgi:hypothetical protein